MTHLSSRMAGFLVFLGLASTCRAADNPYQDLLRRLPDSTNALVLVDGQELSKTLGVTPGTALTSADITSLPIRASRFVLGAHIDLSQHQPLWSVGVCQLEHKMPIQDIAKAENESVQQIESHAVVASPRNAYFVELGPDLLACGSPANRQQLKHWLTYQKNNQLLALPPYLVKASNPKEPALMIFAVELADSLDPAAVRRGLNRSRYLASLGDTNYESVARTIAKVQGLTFTIRPGSPLNGHLTVDFDENVKYNRYFDKSLLLEILHNSSLHIPDFDKWEFQREEKSISFQGPLSLYALRKLGTLIRTPAPPPEAADMEAHQAKTPAQRALVASKGYFHKVTQILDDLHSEKETKTWKALSGWYDRYSDQINKLPTLDVDPDLIAFATATAERLRTVGGLFKQTSSAIGMVHYSSLYANQQSYVETTGGAVTTSQADYALGAQATASRTSLWQQIDAETEKIRQVMTQKYMTQF